MKHIITLICFAVLTISLSANDTKPEKIHRLTKLYKSGDYYIAQAELWKKEIDRDATIPDSWLNYYMAARYSRNIGKKQDVDLKGIAEAAMKAIPNTFEANYLMFAQDCWNDDYKKYLFKAHEIAPDRIEAYEALITHYELARNPEMVKEYMTRMYHRGFYPKDIISWNYNVLQSVSDNAIILTWGDNDTYPAWMLQNAQSMRKDVLILNVHLLQMGDFPEKIFQELDIPITGDWQKEGVDMKKELVRHIVKHTDRPVYFNTTTHPHFREPFQKKLYLTGLTYRYSAKNFDNIATLKNNVENKFVMDYIKVNLGYELSQGIIYAMNMSYIPSFMLLYKHYDESGETSKAATLKALMYKIGKEAQREETIEKYFGSRETNIRSYPELNIKKLEKQYMKVGDSLWASSTELMVKDYDLFLMDLVKNREFDKLAICKIGTTNWKSLLTEEERKLSDEFIFRNGHPDDDLMPIQNISYEAAVLYCEWLTGVYNSSTYKKKKFKEIVFRLPTKEEWIATAKGGNLLAPYPWGGYYYQNMKGCYLSNFGNDPNEKTRGAVLHRLNGGSGKDEPCKDCEEQTPSNDGGLFTVMATSYFPNDFGCYNMSGNVAEMIDEKGVAMGGSWQDNPEDCKVTSSQNYTAPSPSIGFRVFMKMVQQVQ